MSGVDIYLPLPDPETLDLGDAKRLRATLLTQVRPHILRRLAVLGRIADPAIDAQVERIELEMRLAEIDGHDWALDARISTAEPRPSAYTMVPELAELATGQHIATARATLFYSPEAKFNVHGPIMLFHAAALAEHLLAPGETLSHLESANFSKMVISQLRLTLFDTGAEPPRQHNTAMAAASVSGTFRTSAGRRLTFYGIQDHGWPVARTCSANRLALGLIPRDLAFEREGPAYRIRTPAVRFDHAPGVAAQLMTALDTLVLMMLTQHFHPDETRLLVSVRDLPMGPAMLDTLMNGAGIVFTPHVDRARRAGDALVMMPVDIGFARSPDTRTRAMVAESSQPYYRMPLG